MKNGAYYNEFKPEAAHMLRQLIKDGLIADGDVDERSITEVRADDLKGYTQCHFFAGIGLWSVALRLAGCDDNKPVWTGSCPCQPFSSAGKQKGKSDERHLWPVWFELIRQSKPPIVFGEQVPAAISHGWWDDVADDLEREGYTTRAEIRPACSVGRPHKRDRLWFVADTISEGLQRHGGYEPKHGKEGRQAAHGYFGEANIQWIQCPDGKSRPIEPTIPLLVNGYKHRTPILHAIGNGIVPACAQKFIESTKGIVW
jgi:DNA (cytosine-5)-methyltransferase 1